MNAAARGVQLLVRDPFLAGPFRLMDEVLRTGGNGKSVTGFTPALDIRETEEEYWLLFDVNYAGRDFEHAASELDATIIRPRRRDEPGEGLHLAPIRQRVEPIFQTCKDLLNLERHGARTLHGLGTRIRVRFLALTAAIALNDRLGRPPRALVDYTA